MTGVRNKKLWLCAVFMLPLLPVISVKLMARERLFTHYTTVQGLPYSGITDFVQDKSGFMFVATRISVCRFDGYEFQEIPFVLRNGRVPAVRIPKLIKDRENRIFATSQSGELFQYFPNLNRLQEIPLKFSGNEISSLYPALYGGFWMIRDGRPAYIPASVDRVTSIPPLDALNRRLPGKGECLYVREADSLLYLATSEKWILTYDLRNGIIESHELSLPGLEQINFLHVEPGHHIWLSDANKGLYRISLPENRVTWFSASFTGNRRIPHNLVRAIEQDREGNTWIGTENGLGIWSGETDKMEILTYDPLDPEGLNSNAIYEILCDLNGNIWVGTYFGGINLWNSRSEFFNILSEGPGEFKLGGKEVRHITEDREGNIWIGLEGKGVNVLEKSSGRIVRYMHLPNRNSLSYNNVHTIVQGNEGEVYIGTYTGGLNRLDPITRNFSLIEGNEGESLPSRNIYTLLYTGDSLWIGTDAGIAIYHPSTGRISAFHPDILKDDIIECIHPADNKIWISCRHSIYFYDIYERTLQLFSEINDLVSVSFISSDSSGNLWIGDSYNGLFSYGKKSGKVSHFHPANGFPANRVLGVIEGRDGWYWASTSKGLVRFIPGTDSLILYNAASGLPFSQFNYNAFYRDRSNNIYFGGINGLVWFNEDNIDLKPVNREVVFTRFELMNKTVQPGPDSPISGSLNKNRKVVLSYGQRIFTIYFSVLEYIHPGRIQFDYYLEGFNEAWTHAGNKNFASFTNLSPGTYYLHVKAGDENNIWTPESVLEIVVRPPFYLTHLAFVFYGLLAILSLLLFYNISTRIEKAKGQAMLAKQEKEYQAKLNQFKLEFFTDIAHDLRTPLSLIIGPLSNVLRTKEVDESFWEKIDHIKDNSRRLLSLINQLLEFRRADLGKERLQVCKVDVKAFVGEIAEAFQDVADSRNIIFSWEVNLKESVTWMDPRKIERILFNLLSNAFKFTGDEGRISLEVSETSSVETAGVQKRFLCFKVKDTGRGIPEEIIEVIFDRFFDDNARGIGSGSSGIGLSLVKKLVVLHKGDISVESKIGKGSVFSFLIPAEKDSFSDNEVTSGDSVFSSSASEWIELELPGVSPPTMDDNQEFKPLIMVVDDNRELLDFLFENLKEKFNVRLAGNGKEALTLMAEEIPDLVITDVMMPEMDGIALTEHLKSDIRTSHIPVILLSSKTETEHKFEGLSSGADFYMEKPFYPHILIKHVENILATRQKLIDSFRKDIHVSAAEVTHSRSDREFIEKLTAVIMENLDNPELDVSLLLSEINMSRTLLHLKLKKIANCSATGFIRTIRLKEAAKMIASGDKTISEAAYATGFSSPSFFSKRFREFFGKSPKEYFQP